MRTKRQRELSAISQTRQARKILFDFLRVQTLRTIFELDVLLEWIRLTYYYNRQRYLGIISPDSISSHDTWLNRIPRNMRRNTQREQMKMTKLSLWLPLRTVESVEKIRGYYSLNRWVWRAIERQLQQEEEEKIALRA